MSVGLAVGPAPSPVGPLGMRRLMITLGSARRNDRYPDGTCAAHDVDILLERVLESHTVLVERSGGAALARLRSAYESDVAWLSHVLIEVLGQLSGTPLACALVGNAIRLTAGVPVAIECRAADQTAPRPVGTVRCRPTLRGEISLIRSARGVWMLVCPTGSVGFASEYPALLAALTRCLCEADADDVRDQNALRQQLAHEVSCAHGSRS